MTTPYKDQLTAIQKLLASPMPEEVEEGFDSLFNLWLSNNESSDFLQDMVPIAVEHEKTMQEFKTRLDALIINDVITGSYLQKRLRHLGTEIARFRKPSQLASTDANTASMIKGKMRETNPRFALWQISLTVIIIGSLGLMVVLPNIYQKGIMLLIAISCATVFPLIFSQNQHRIIAEGLNIKLNYSFPKYLSIGDENSVDLSIENPNEIKFTGELTMVFNDDNSLIMPVAGKKLSTSIDVLPHDRETYQFKFVLKNKPVDGNIDYHFLIFSSSGSRYKTNNEFFLISPIPHLRSIWSWFFGSAGLGAAIIALLWDELKALLGF